MKNLFVVVITALTSFRVDAQKIAAIKRIDPVNWWVGMKNPNLQLLIYGPNAGTLSYTIHYPGVKLVKTSRVENPNYAFLDLTIAPSAKPGTFNVVGRSATETFSKKYVLRERSKEPKATGVTSADFISCSCPTALPIVIPLMINLLTWPIPTLTPTIHI